MNKRTGIKKRIPQCDITPPEERESTWRIATLYIISSRTVHG
jgi:hypothetical protein